MFNAQFHIYHSDCDRNGYLKTDLFQEMILNTACSAAEAGGFGIPELNRTGRTWVMARFQMHVNSHPRIGDTISIDTWIEQNRLGFSIRNFRVFICNTDCACSLSAEARSAWAVIDVHTRQNVNFSDLPHIPIPEGNPIVLPSIPRPNRKAALITSSHTVLYSDLDQNGHCNSSRYVQMMIDAYNSIDGLRPTDMIISYSHEAFFGETLRITRSDSSSPFFAIHNPSETLCVTAQFLLPNTPLTTIPL